MPYIDKDEAIKAAVGALRGVSQITAVDVAQALEDLPTIDGVPTAEGEWIEHDDDWCGAFYTCSVCKCDWTTIDGTPQENNMRFCPECGAKMKGGAE